jgi:hypothetical protein
MRLAAIPGLKIETWGTRICYGSSERQIPFGNDRQNSNGKELLCGDAGGSGMNTVCTFAESAVVVDSFSFAYDSELGCKRWSLLRYR